MLSQETINELGQILKEEYGEELSSEKVSDIARTSVGYFGLLARLHHRNNENDNDTKQNNRME